MSKYRCSIFCSFYKGEKFIQGYIENILQQTIFEDIEFVFLNGASPENEEPYILPLLEKYANIRYIKLEKDPGLYAAWNIAINYCSSEIIGNWNIDDRKNPESIESLLKEFDKDADLEMVYGVTYISRIANETFEENDRTEIYPFFDISLEALLNHNSPHCMPLWKKQIHNKIGYFNEQYATVSDAEMWLKLLLSGGKIKALHQAIGLYYWNPEGRSTNIEFQQTNAQEAMLMKNRLLS